MPICPAGHDSVADDYCDTCGLALMHAPGPAPGSGQASGPGPAAGSRPSSMSGQAPSEPAPASGQTPPVSSPGSQPAPSGPAPTSGEPSGPREVFKAPPGSASVGGGTTCPACDEPASGRFCESCGYDLVSGGSPAPAVVTLTLSADRDHWERMVGSGEPAFPVAVPALTFQLTGDRATLGRVRTGVKPDVDVALTGAAADPAVSHHQCEFERRGDSGGWVVRDSGSANGTWINDADQPLAAGQIHTLTDGDRIRMGAWTCLTVHITRPAAP